MKPERWKQIEVVFSQVADLDPNERKTSLDELCADDSDLRVEVDILLADDEEATREYFLETTTSWPYELNSDAADALIGQRIGCYQIEEYIGGGGMGDVYLALRVEPFKKRVAIKFIKPSMDTENMLRRFKGEMQIHAALGEHANIAGLLDAGATEDGRPYFVMEYVEGERIDRYCDKEKMSIHDRVTLFRSVLSAVQYAHQNLVIHLDLKPSNILVTKDGTPKLVDFGIAKLVNPDMVNQATVGTDSGGLTWRYASPEQVRQDPIISTASDMYSLGVVLFELLTGHRPYELDYRPTQEIKRIVCEVDPEKPSVIIGRELTVHQNDDTTRTVTPDEICELRNARPALVRRLLARGLDKVLLNALRKTPQGRLKTVGEFSEALRHWLEWRPVPTLPSPTLIERFHCWCRRNPAVSGLMALVIVVAMVGFYRTTDALKTAYAALQQEAGFRKALLGTTYFKVRSEALDDGAADAKFKSLLASTIAETIKMRDNLNDPSLGSDEEREVWRNDLRSSPARIALENRLIELRGKHSRVGSTYNWFILDANGLFLARDPAEDGSVGKNYAWRSYFHGGLRDFEDHQDYLDNSGATVVKKTHLSAAFQSKKEQDVALWAITTPVMKDGVCIGVVGLRVEIDKTGVDSPAQN